MVPVWLCAADGRAMYCIYVPTPMPPSVTYPGRIFYLQDGRYVEGASQAPYAPGYEAGAALPPHEAEVAPADVAGRTPKEDRVP